MSDQECVLSGPLETLRNVEYPCKGLCHAMCYYHLIEQPWQNEIAGTCHNLAQTNALEVTKDWIKSWFCNIVNEHQFAHSYDEFEKYMAENRSIFIKSYDSVINVWNNMKVKRCRRAKCCKGRLMGFDHETSSFSQYGNVSLKRYGQTRLDSVHLDEAAYHAREHSEQLEMKREM